jgi:fatty acid desaturase
MMANSWKDAWLVAASALQFIVLIGMYVFFERDALLATISLSALSVFLMCTNFQCVAHNFIHRPFFSHQTANTVFAIWNTILLGLPQTIYKYHHLNHHRYNNDYQNANGATEDYSSIFRYSKHPQIPESAILYSILGPFRTDVGLLYRNAQEHGQAPQILTETAIYLILLLTVAVLSPSFVFLCYLPTWYLGQVGAYLENYFEHYGATPGNRKTDSVSCYNRFYNLIWFNNGYHQEHHYRPQVHWSEIASVTTELCSEPNRKIVNYAHWFNWPILEALPSRKAKDSEPIV